MEAARPATSDGPSKSLGPLEARLAAQLAFDESKQKVLEALLADNEDLRKQNMALDMENRRLQHTLDLDQRRHKEMLSEDQFSDTYDWIVDIQLLSDVSKQGWSRWIEAGHDIRAVKLPTAVCSTPEHAGRRHVVGWAHLNERPFVATFLPEGSFVCVREFRTNVLPLS